jgi:hypothetical protein
VEILAQLECQGRISLHGHRKYDQYRVSHHPPAGTVIGANVMSRVTDNIIRGGLNYPFSAY